MNYRWQQRHADKPVIVYQMGKVGSSSVAAGLRKQGYDVYQVHVLTQEWIKRVDKQYIKASKDHNNSIVEEHLLASMYLRHELDRVRWRFGDKPKVITLIRDPVARNISSFFQAFDIYFSEESVSYKRQNMGEDDLLNAMIGLFLDHFQGHDTPLNWYDVHFNPVFNVDVFATAFPAENGYKIYNGHNAEVLLIRLEDLRNVALPAFREFLGIEYFELEDVNVGSEKDYASIYGRFRKKIRLPKKYLDHMYESKYAKHFYTNSELKKFRARWAESNTNAD